MADLTKYKAKDNKTVREHTDDVLGRAKTLYEMGYVDERIYKILEVACEYHDYGKMNIEFQKRINAKTKFDAENEISHNILSLYFINPDIENYITIACSVLFHHYYCDEFTVINEKEELINKLLEEFKDDIYSIGKRSLKKIKETMADLDTIKVKGLLHRCDYSASSDTVIEYSANYLTDKLDAMMNEWKQERPNSSWNDLQKFCKENTNNNIIVTAPTGMGKTEAGLLWIGDNKGFFILPLKTAINAIYDRVKDKIIKNEKVDTRLGLLHSDTKSYYSHQDVETDFMEYYNQTKMLSMPLTISTLDQLFDFVFKYRGYEMKLATLAYSKLVIDEIQMYSADILAYLIYGIKMIVENGGKVAILTATLSPFIKDILKEEGFKGDVVEAGFTNDLNRHNLKVMETELDCEMIADIYKNNKAINKPNKILVVCNTAKKSQEIYEKLYVEYGIKEINLLHNKFTKADRAEKEKNILEFGKTENTNESGIWVATSIVEASLDIDFDILFTELSDINALFQRLGRCNRKGVKSVKEYNCYIFTEINKGILKREANGKGFIDEYLYRISKEAILKVDGVISESDKVKIIEDNFTTKKVKNSPYYERYRKTMQIIQSLNVGEHEGKVELRDIESEDVIPEVLYLNNKNYIDELIRVINCEESTRLDKINAMDKIKGYMVSLQTYETKKCTVAQILEINSYMKVKVVKCDYDKNIGYRASQNDDCLIIS